MKKPARLAVASRIAALCITSALGLTACGGSTESKVAQICINAIDSEIGDQPFESNAKQFASVIREEGEGIVVIESTVIVDKGLTSETKRGFMCRVQTDPQGKAAPSLILLQLGF